MTKFKTIKAMNKFISDFKAKYPDPKRMGDFWIDYAITNIQGDIILHDPSNKLDE